MRFNLGELRQAIADHTTIYIEAHPNQVTVLLFAFMIVVSHFVGGAAGLVGFFILFGALDREPLRTPTTLGLIGGAFACELQGGLESEAEGLTGLIQLFCVLGAAGLSALVGLGIEVLRVPKLILKLNERDERVRSRAVDRLARIGRPAALGAVPALRERLHAEADEGLKDRIRNALAKIEGNTF